MEPRKRLCGEALEHQGWKACLTGDGNTGDQKIYMREGAQVRFSMNIS